MSSSVDLDIFQILHEHRTAFGAKRQDYKRYRTHCSSRLQTLRRGLKLGSKPAKGAPKGKGEFQKLPVLKPEEIKDAKYLEVLLFSSERAQTYSSELNAQSKLSSTSTAPPPPSSHAHSLTRSSKAVKYASHLLSSLPPTVSSRTLVQATVYHLISTASHSFLKKIYDEAILNLIVARGLLTSFINIAGEKVSPGQEAVILSIIDEELDPKIKICAFQLGRKDSSDVEGICDEFGLEERLEALPSYSELIDAVQSEFGDSSSGAGLRKVGGVKWLGHSIEYRNADVVKVMAKVDKEMEKIKLMENFDKSREGSEKRARIKGGKMKAYEKLLLALGEAVDVIGAMKEQGESSALPSNLRSSTLVSLGTLFDYLTHSLLSRRIQRDLLLVSALVKSSLSAPPNDQMKSLTQIIKLHDGVLQSLSSLRELATIEADGVVAEAVDAKLDLYRAKRCFFLATLHLKLGSPAKTLILLSRATLYCRQARSLSPTYESDILALTDQGYDKFDQDIETLDKKAKEHWFDETEGSPQVSDVTKEFIKVGIPGGAEVVTQAPVKKAEKMKVDHIQQQQPEKEEEEEEDNDSSSGDEEFHEAEEKPGWLGGWFSRK